MDDPKTRQDELRERAQQVGVDPDLMLDEREEAGEKESPAAEPVDERER